MLGQVQRMPVLRMADAKDEVDHFGAAFLPFLYCFGRTWVRAHVGAGPSAAAGVHLPKDATPVSKGVRNGRPKLPQDLSKSFLEVLVDFDVRVGADDAVGHLRAGRDVGIRVIFPAACETLTWAVG